MAVFPRLAGAVDDDREYGGPGHRGHRVVDSQSQSLVDMGYLFEIASRCFRTDKNGGSHEACCNAIAGYFVLDILRNFHSHSAEAASSVLLRFAENLSNPSPGLCYFPVSLHYCSRQTVQATISPRIQGRHEHSYLEKSSEFFITNALVVSQ